MTEMKVGDKVVVTGYQRALGDMKKHLRKKTEITRLSQERWYEIAADGGCYYWKTKWLRRI